MKHPYTDQSAEMQRVMEYAISLGFHGLMILSPVCTQCGALHQWSMLSDLSDEPTGTHAPDIVVDLLTYYAERAKIEPGLDLGPAGSRRPDA